MLSTAHGIDAQEASGDSFFFESGASRGEPASKAAWAEQGFHALLLVASRSHPPAAPELWHQACAQGELLDALWVGASYHGTWPLVYQNLLAYQGIPALDTRIPRWRPSVFRESVRTRFLLNELGEVLEGLRSQQLNALVVKGPALAQRAYGGLAGRAFMDLDLVIAPCDFDRVGALLERLGYQPFTRLAAMNAWERRFYRWRAGQYPFSRGPGTFNLDLHVRLMPRANRFVFSFDELHGRSQGVCIDGIDVPTLGDEDHLLVLCYHGAKNRWERLKHVADVAELVRARQGELDWEQLFQQARRTRGVRVLLLGLHLAQKLLDVPLPERVRRHLERQERVVRMGSRLMQRLAQWPPEPMAFTDRLRFHLAVQETLGTKAQYAVGSLLRYFD